MSALVRLYPAAWQARYGREFEALLVERPPTARDILDIVLAAVDARLSPQVTAAPIRRTPISARLAGGAAIAGGLTWCVTALAAAVLERDADLTLPILAALALMLLSLPGSYLSSYVRPVAVGTAALAISIGLWAMEVIPWGPVLLIPMVVVLVVLLPGALALAATRARIRARDRWRLLLLTMPWPITGIVAGLAGVVPEAIGLPLLIASLLPLGIAWIVTGARIARGSFAESTIASAGGTA